MSSELISWKIQEDFTRILSEIPLITADEASSNQDSYRSYSLFYVAV